MPDGRFVVRELTGFPFGGTASGKPQTDVYVMDSWYCYAVVWSTSTARTVPASGGGLRGYDEKLIAARSAAAREARTLNDEHAAWVTSVDVTPPTRKDAAT